MVGKNLENGGITFSANMLADDDDDDDDSGGDGKCLEGRKYQTSLVLLSVQLSASVDGQW